MVPILRMSTVGGVPLTSCCRREARRDRQAHPRGRRRSWSRCTRPAPDTRAAAASIAMAESYLFDASACCPAPRCSRGYGHQGRFSTLLRRTHDSGPAHREVPRRQLSIAAAPDRRAGTPMKKPLMPYSPSSSAAQAARACDRRDTTRPSRSTLPRARSSGAVLYSATTRRRPRGCRLTNASSFSFGNSLSAARHRRSTAADRHHVVAVAPPSTSASMSRSSSRALRRRST